MVFRGLHSYRQRVRVITPFSNNFVELFLHIEWVCKSFWKESLTRTSSSFISVMQGLHFQIRVGVFNCQEKDLFRYLRYCGKKTNWMWFSLVFALIDNDTRHHPGVIKVVKFWPLSWPVSLSIRVHTTLIHIRFVKFLSQSHNKWAIVWIQVIFAKNALTDRENFRISLVV